MNHVQLAEKQQAEGQTRERVVARYAGIEKVRELRRRNLVSAQEEGDLVVRITCSPLDQIDQILAPYEHKLQKARAHSRDQEKKTLVANFA